MSARPASWRAAVQGWMLRFDRFGPGRAFLQAVYALFARVYTTYVCHGERDATTYVAGTVASGEALHGLTDIDIVVVTNPDPDGAIRSRIRHRCETVRDAVPLLRDVVDDWPLIHDQPGLAAVAGQSTLTFGLGHGGAVYAGPGSDIDRIRMLERPGLYGPTRTWRILSGPERRPSDSFDADSRRIRSWLELQNWWRWAFQACVEPDRPSSAYMCVKLIAEAARIWVWLTRGERIPDRATALARARVELPAEAEVFERARRLHRSLDRVRSAPLDAFLPAFVRLSTRIADEVERQLADAGRTWVRLTGGHERDQLPLVDWRALSISPEPHETFVLLAGDPGDPEVVRQAARAARRSVHPVLSGPSLMIRPSPMGGRARLRAVQCASTDPVSFALVGDSERAAFPDVPGWSLPDTVCRAVAEHCAQLGAAETTPGGAALGPLLTAMRTALLWETWTEGEPQLPLTVDSTLDLLIQREQRHSGVANAAREDYHRGAGDASARRGGVITALREAVLTLPAYSSAVCRTPEPV